MKNPTSFGKKITQLTVWFFGSWIGVILHTVFFITWFVLNLELEVLLVLVSLEAIYIGMFILMAENAEAQQKERLEKRRRTQLMKIVNQDESVDRQTHTLVKKMHKDLQTLTQHLENLYKKGA